LLRTGDWKSDRKSGWVKNMDTMFTRVELFYPSLPAESCMFVRGFDDWYVLCELIQAQHIHFFIPSTPFNVLIRLGAQPGSGSTDYD
jgi:hypothetical protein